MKEIGRDEGRRAFGMDPASYDQGRPEYPRKVYEILQLRCGLRQGSRLFEIGPGTGLATKRLLELGADPVVAIEPDERLAAFLTDSLKKYSDRMQVKIAAFEDIDLPLAWFDIGVAATAMHWLDEETALRKVARTLQPGGWWAMWWNVFRDPEQPDELTEAAPNLLSVLTGALRLGKLEDPHLPWTLKGESLFCRP
jgi:SAM-dependent methyltransferase